MTTLIQVFDIASNRLDPAFDPEHAHELGVNLAASETYPRGQVLSEFPPGSGTFIKYSVAAGLAAGAAPVLTTPVGGTLPAGDYTVRYRFLNAGGQASAMSAAATTTAALNDQVHVALVALGAGAVAIEWFVSLTPGDAVNLKSVLTNDGSAADLPMAVAGDDDIPATTTEFTWFADGPFPAQRLLRYACVTDAAGLITIGSSGASDPIVSQPDADSFISGIFHTAELVGLTADALADLKGILLSGTLADGVMKF